MTASKRKARMQVEASSLDRGTIDVVATVVDADRLIITSRDAEHWLHRVIITIDLGRLVATTRSPAKPASVMVEIESADENKSMHTLTVDDGGYVKYSA